MVARASEGWTALLGKDVKGPNGVVYPTRGKIQFKKSGSVSDVTIEDDATNGATVVTFPTTAATSVGSALYNALRTSLANDEFEADQKVFTPGRGVANDGGQGTFTFVSGGSFTDDDGTVLTAGGFGSTHSEALVRDNASHVDARWFGLSAAAADNSTAIQRAMNAADIAGLKWLQLPRGDFKIKSSLILDNDAGEVFLDFELRGANPTRDSIHGTRLIWDGSTTDPMIKLYSRGVRITGLWFSVADGKETDAAIVWDRPTSGLAATHIWIERCFFLGTHGTTGIGTMTDGVLIGPTAGINNLEAATFIGNHFQGLEHAGVYVASTTGQSKLHKFIANAFTYSNYGIYCYTGSFTASKTEFGRIDTSCIYVGATTDMIAVDDIDLEDCARFFENNNTGTPHVISISNARFGISDRLAADGKFIRCYTFGPFFLKNTLWEPSFSNTLDPDTVKISLGNGGEDVQLVSSGNWFCNTRPWTTEEGADLFVDSSGDWGRVWSSGPPFSPASPSWQLLPSRGRLAARVRSGVLTYDSIDPTRKLYDATNGSAHAVTLYTPDRDGIFFCTFQASSRKPDGTSATWVKTATFKNVSGTVSLVGSVDEPNPHKDAGAAAWDFALSTDGTDILGTTTTENTVRTTITGQAIRVEA